MKHGKKPTREERKIILCNGLDSHDWLVFKHTDDRLYLVHKTEERVEIIKL